MHRAPPRANHSRDGRDVIDVLMGREAKTASGFDQIHAPVLQCFTALCDQLGGEASALLRAADIGAPKIPAAGPAVTYRQMCGLFALAARRLGCADFGMCLAQRQADTDVLGPLGQAIAVAPTFWAALDSLSRFSYAHSLALSMRLRRSHMEGAVAQCFDVLLDPSPDIGQAIEHVVLMARLTAGKLSGGWIRPVRVDLRHQPIADPVTYRRHFGCDVRFSQQDNAIHYNVEDLSRPLVAADISAFRQALKLIAARFPSRMPLKAQVRGIIVHHLGSGPATV
ncbi:MAG: AraC family transcriptional regulator ligand-binding domain-containing protein, partial [Novosphingobium sp.]